MTLASLRTRLAFLVGLGLLPILGIVVFLAGEYRESLADRVQREVFRLASEAAATATAALVESEGLLDGVATSPAVVAGPGTACAETLRGVVKKRGLTVGVADRDGAVWCTSAPGGAGPRVAKDAWFAAALSGVGFTIGAAPRGAPSEAPLVVVARSLRDPTGPVGVLYATFDPLAVEPGGTLPGGSFVVAVDPTGAVLNRSPPDATWVGTSFPDRVAASGLLQMPVGVADRVSIEGSAYVLARVPVMTRGDVAMHVFVGVPRESAFAPVEAMLRGVFVTVALITLIVIGLSWFVSDFLLLRRVGALVVAAERLGAGDLGARAGLAHGPDEFGRLASSFDQMASNIERLTALHRQTIEAAGEGILTLTPNGRISSANPAAARILGLRGDQVVGAGAHALLHGYEGSGHEDTDCPLKLPARAGTEERRDDDSFQRSGAPRFPASWVATPLRDGGKVVGAVVVFVDQSQRTRMELQLVEAARTEAVGQLAGGVAHDFNNLLTAIRGYADLLKAEITPGSRAAKDAEAIVQAAHQASGLTRELLAFSRRRESSVEVIAVDQVIMNIERLVRRIVGEHIDVEFVFEDPAGAVRVDAAQLEQVVLNLVMNARDAMPDGGRVVIETSGDHPEGASETDAWVCISVSDGGEGIPADRLALVFDPFYTTRAASTGLGLATVSRVVRGSGGLVSVTSVVGEGTTFRVYLPRAGSDQPAVTDPETS